MRYKVGQHLYLCKSHLTALDALYEKDEREDRYIGEVLARCRGEDTGDLKELNWLRRGDVSRFSRSDLFLSNSEILTEEKSWIFWEIGPEHRDG